MIVEWVCIEHWCNDTEGKAEVLEKILSQYYFVHKNPTRTSLGLNRNSTKVWCQSNELYVCCHFKLRNIFILTTANFKFDIFFLLTSLLLIEKRMGATSVSIYRAIKKSLFTWWLQYRKLQVMFKVSPANLHTLLGSIWLLGSRPPGPGH
jgi:hypothetical protein